MTTGADERRALALILGLLVIAAAARWLERPRELLLEDVPALDVAALEDASRAARGPARERTQARTPAAVATSVGAPAPLIDPNTAAAEELQRLPGIGPAMAQRIVDAREAAPFRSVADLQRVRGIGPAQAARLAEHVTLPAAAEPPPLAAPVAPPRVTSRADPAPGLRAAAAAVDLNSAGTAELQSLPGVGPVLAARLIARRDSLGRFRSWDDVDAVPGVGPAMLARLRERATLSP